MEPLPYLPTSQRFLNTLYIRIGHIGIFIIRVETIPKFPGLKNCDQVRELRTVFQQSTSLLDTINCDSA